VSAYVEDVAVINGSVDGGRDEVAAEVVIAVSATEAHTIMPSNKSFRIHGYL